MKSLQELNCTDKISSNQYLHSSRRVDFKKCYNAWEVLKLTINLHAVPILFQRDVPGILILCCPLLV